MRTTPLGALTRLALLVGVSALAGVLVAGLAFPLIGGAGLAARAGADSFDSLPSELKTSPLPQRSTILAADGTPIATIYLQNRVVVPLSAIPVVARQAVIAIEDSRFYEHHGVDYKGLLRALVENQRAGEVRQGGSTLTQQYVKNVLIEQARTKAARQAATERSTSRKLREARYALALEEKLSKPEILERYLNIAYFGSGAYGIATAAQRYFGKRPAQLTLAEAALLAGLVKNPTAYDPARNRGRPAITRRNVVLARMRELGFITPQQEAAAVKAPVTLHLTTVPNGCTGARIAPFFCDYVVRQLKETPGIGSSRLLRGGLVIRTTLDPTVQRAAQAAVDRAVERTNRVAMAAVVVQPGTGEVKAMAVSRGFGKSTQGRGVTEVPLALRPAYQGGSTFKVFTLAAMLERGVPLSLSLECPAQYTSQVFKKGPGLGPYQPKNAGDSESGFFNVPTATWESVNTCFVQYIERIGVAPVARMAERLGAGVEAAKVGANQGSFTLGTYDVSPLNMATAYATLAAHGLRCRPRPLVSVQAPGNGLVQLPPKDCEQVLEPRVADTVTDVLRGVIDGPAPGRTGRGAHIGRPAAGKTGTTNNSAAAWFVGYTPQLAAAIWMGDPRGNKYGMRGVTIQGRTYRQVYGGTIAAPAWARLMGAALEGEPVQRFRAPDESLYGGRTSPIPDVTGLSVESAREALRALGYGVRVSSRRVYAFPIAAGLVGRTDPLPGESLAPGETVVLYKSNGGLPPRKPRPRPSPTATFVPAPSPSSGTGVPTPKPTRSKRRCPPGKPNC